MIMNRTISKLAVVSSPQQASLNGGVAPRQSKLSHRMCLQDVCLLTLIQRMSFFFSVCVFAELSFCSLLKNNNSNDRKRKKCPEQPSPLYLHIRESCCDKLCRWLNTAIRQHTVCLTKCFLSDTLELSWLLAAWFQVFIWAQLWGSASISGGSTFCHHCDPTAEDTWSVAADGAAAAGLHIHSDGAMLDLSGGPLPCPPSIRKRLFCVTLWHICWHVSFGNRC